MPHNHDTESCWRLRGDADLVGETLRGISFLLIGWGEYLAQSRPSPRGQDQVTLALTFTLDALADRLQPPVPSPRPPPTPRSAGPRLAVVPNDSEPSGA